MQTQLFHCDHHDMVQNTRCSVAECGEFNEQRLIFTDMLSCVCVCECECECECVL